MLTCSCCMNKNKVCEFYMILKYSHINKLNCNQQIHSLTIELDCKDEKKIDLSILKNNLHLDRLKIKNLSGHRINVIKLENIQSLKVVDLFNIGCDSIVVNGCENLYRINCACNEMKYLEINNCKKLSIVSCYNNLLNNLTLESDSLCKVHCACNNLDTLILKSKVFMKDLVVGHNPINFNSVLDIPDNVSWITISQDDTILKQIFGKYNIDEHFLPCEVCPYTMNLNHQYAKPSN